MGPKIAKNVYVGQVGTWERACELARQRPWKHRNDTGNIIGNVNGTWERAWEHIVVNAGT